jgi:alpha-tubulin suppressor-like RCC1 family protein
VWRAGPEPRRTAVGVDHTADATDEQATGSDAGSNGARASSRNGGRRPRSVPDPLHTDRLGDDLYAVWAGWSHAWVAQRDGTMWCWGNNYAGRLGQRDIATDLAPPQMPRVKSRNAEVGWYTTVVIAA